MHRPDISSLMFAGCVGAYYRPNIDPLLIAINPGGGDDSGLTPIDDIFCSLLRQFRNAAPERVLECWERVNAASLPTFRTWNLWKIIKPTLEAVNRPFESCCLPQRRTLPHARQQDAAGQSPNTGVGPSRRTDDRPAGAAGDHRVGQEGRCRRLGSSLRRTVPQDDSSANERRQLPEARRAGRARRPAYALGRREVAGERGARARMCNVQHLTPVRSDCATSPSARVLLSIPPSVPRRIIGPVVEIQAKPGVRCPFV